MALSEDFGKPARNRPRRFTSRTFLEDCPDRIAEIFHYWDRIRRDRRMPCRADFDPAEVVRHLPSILLIDVEGVDDRGCAILRYRVVGTEEVRLRDHDPTGKLVSEGFLGPSLESVMEAYELVRRERCFLYEEIEFATPTGVWRREYGILMPLSEDGQTVTQILVYSLPRDALDED
ncbi:MAG TPA: PAS domain-containing protein [Kiloniellaceae bacterium]|nr:PAS domain-containing protein [Kiloniellaceae bacterium]